MEKPKTPVKLVGDEVFTPDGVRSQRYLDRDGNLWLCSTNDDFNFCWRRIIYATPQEAAAALKGMIRPRRPKVLR